MLALLGLTTVILLLALITSRLMSPLVALIIVPAAGAVVGGFGLSTGQFILNGLQQDGRMSNLKLAESVSPSATAVLARVNRLSKEGYILGYEARLNPLKLGAGMMVFVEVLLDRTTPNVFEAFKAAVQVRGEIMECHMVAGGFDYLLKTRMADISDGTSQVIRSLIPHAKGFSN